MGGGEPGCGEEGDGGWWPGGCSKTSTGGEVAAVTWSRYGAPQELAGVSAPGAGQDTGAAHRHPDVVHLEGDEAEASGTRAGLAPQDHHGLVDGHRVEGRRLPTCLDVHAAAAEALGEGQLARVAVLILIDAADGSWGTRSVSPLPLCPLPKSPCAGINPSGQAPGMLPGRGR